MLRHLFTTALLAWPIAAFNAAAEPTQERFQQWLVECDGRCIAGQVVSQTVTDGAGNEATQRLLQFILSETPQGQSILEMILPLGVDLRPGLVYQVDDRTEQQLTYTACTQLGCSAVILVDADLLAAMRAGSSMKVGFRPYGTDRTVAVEASLAGFTRASREVLSN